jgi:hypothetical protein
MTKANDSTQPDIPQDLRQLYEHFTDDYFKVQAIYLAQLPRKDLLTLIERIARLETQLASVTAELERARLQGLLEAADICAAHYKPNAESSRDLSIVEESIRHRVSHRGGK